jgi:CheY-like chemotaxis protein
MTEAEPHRRQPTDEEKFAAAGAEDYLGVPISDEELADVWTSRPGENDSDAGQGAPDEAPA